MVVDITVLMAESRGAPRTLCMLAASAVGNGGWWGGTELDGGQGEAVRVPQADGTLVAQDIEVIMDGGAYCTLTPVVLSRGTIHASGPYYVPNVRVRGRAVATNVPPHGAFRGFGAPQTTFAYERQMAKLARARARSRP